jgi:acyl carrier protein
MADVSTADGPDDVLATVLEIVRKVLEKPEMSADDDFLVFGGDSFRMVLLVQALEERFGISVDPGLAFDAPTPREMSKWIAAEASGDDG